MLDESEIGRKIKQLRQERGLNLVELAAKTGFTKGYISKVENSKKSPPVSTLITIATALGVSLATIFSDEENKKSITLVKKSERKVMARRRHRVRLLIRAFGAGLPGKEDGALYLNTSGTTQGTGCFPA